MALPKNHVFAEKPLDGSGWLIKRANHEPIYYLKATKPVRMAYGASQSAGTNSSGRHDWLTL